jgi:hypothetical protein
MHQYLKYELLSTISIKNYSTPEVIKKGVKRLSMRKATRPKSVPHIYILSDISYY